MQERTLESAKTARDGQADKAGKDYSDAHVMRDEKLIASVTGFAVGDALGVPFEFKEREELKENPAIDMIGFGTHGMPKGTWSDDTSMVLATMDSIIRLGVIDYDDIMQRFVEWYKKEEYTATGVLFDIGITTKRSLDRYISGKKYHKCGSTSFYENGNGSLMRMLPLAIYLSLVEVSEQKKAEYVYYLSSLTHAHEISLMACMLYCDLFKILLNEECSLRDALKMLQKKDYEKYYEDSIIHYKRILDGSILDLDEQHIKSSGYVVDTFEAVVWCLANSENYKDAVLTAINLGNDTDTIAAITGSLATVMYGGASIPSEWMITLQRNKMIYEMGEEYIQQIRSLNTV